MFRSARRVGWVRGASWGALSLAGCLAIACGGSPEDTGLRIAVPTPQATPTVEAAQSASLGSSSGAPVTDNAEGALRPAPAERPAIQAPSVVEPGDANGWLLEIPEIDVRAATATFGLSPTGVMEVPADHRTVAWYDFTSVPGRVGNAVLAAHVNWRGEQGVFSRLDRVSPGAVIGVTSPAGERFTYLVESVELVDLATADVGAIVGSRGGGSTLTLITCGGTFNTSTRDYEQRVIVRAVLEEGGIRS